jgi:8-oxo-dGTP pyrophosphatase MutT (NUDIX family)
MDSRRTLCLVHTDTHILLGLKKRGFGAGRWNGFGGKLQPGETLNEATARELKEESGLVASSLEERGILHFTFQDGSAPLEVHVFVALAWAGEPQETEEMRPQWFLLSEIPYHGMWADDRHWLPLLLAGQRFTGYFSFQDTTTLLEHRVEPVAVLA